MATVLMGLQLHQDPILRVSSLHMYQSQLSCFFLPIHAVLPHPLGDTPYYFFSAYYYMPYPLCGSLTAFFRLNALLKTFTGGSDITRGATGLKELMMISAWYGRNLQYFGAGPLRL